MGGIDTRSETETFPGTVALLVKYRFSVSVIAGRFVAVLDPRIPTRKERSIIGSGNVGTCFTFVGEYHQVVVFKPYLSAGT